MPSLNLAREAIIARGAVSTAERVFREAVGSFDPADQASIDVALAAALEYQNVVAVRQSLLGLRDRSTFVRDVDGQTRNLLAEAVGEHAWPS